MSDYERFLAFYGNNKTDGCYAAADLGGSYVCPTPTIGGRGSPMGSGNPKQDPKSGVPTANLGRLAYCAVPAGAEQTGGSYTATGRFRQRGGNPEEAEVEETEQVEAEQEVSPKASASASASIGPNGPGLPHPAYPQPKIQSIPITGYYMNLEEAPIGGRPVHSKHDNFHPNNITNHSGHLLENKFNCQQPFWCERCL